MKTNKIKIILSIFLSVLICSQLFAQNGKVFKETFDAKEKIKIKLVLGDCIIKKSDNSKILVTVNYTYDDDNYEVRVKEKEKSLTLQEKFYGENAQGDSEWTIYLPEHVEIDFSTATGNLTVENVSVEIEASSGTGNLNVSKSNGEFDLNSGTGDVKVDKSEGEFSLNSGTGDVQIADSKGEFDINSGTGDVKGFRLVLEEDGDFNSGTGDAEMTDPMGDNFDLSINSGTGDATLILDDTTIGRLF